MATKFQAGDRVRIRNELFPTATEGLFNALAGTGVVVQVEPDSILPYQARMDGLVHHPFWFYENQLLFEDAAKEKAWQEANKPKPRAPAGAAPKPAAPAHEHGGSA